MKETQHYLGQDTIPPMPNSTSHILSSRNGAMKLKNVHFSAGMELTIGHNFSKNKHRIISAFVQQRNKGEIQGNMRKADIKDS